ncbi:MAG: 2-amino-4-hydroxy-6-hydroxymethyldihydropteridine diphosphokinase [Clostridiales bacterium]|jgi:dihydroneopterin aldolase/2-amino-4-hydroxy-6-hydroxymethyldihydropteridine diphosphokinase|nr:2-amino-4-hydroxy-6-hydroxymethyldihydropteridine diphosphokinase [Clostridiales bacterium]
MNELLDKLSIRYNKLSCECGDDDKSCELEYDIQVDLYLGMSIELDDSTYIGAQALMRLVKCCFVKTSNINLAMEQFVNLVFDSYPHVARVEIALNHMQDDIHRTIAVTRSKKTVYLGLGSNIGDKLSNIRRAISQLRDIGTVKKVSNYYKTKPVGPIPQDDYLNAAVQFETHVVPLRLLKQVKDIEQAMGRVQVEKWGPRIIDIDILMYGQEVYSGDNLIIPHPHMHKRAFVLKPMLDISPYTVHPIYNASMTELYEYLN